MIVCHCLAVSDRALRRCIRDGISDLCSLEERSGAGTDCGGCLPLVTEILNEELASQASRATRGGFSQRHQLPVLSDEQL